MQSFDLNNIWEHILQEAKRTCNICLTHCTLRVTSSLDSPRLSKVIRSIYGVMQTFVKNLIDQQPQISKAFAGCYYHGYRSHRDMVLFDFNQESVDTTFVDESLIDDAPVVAPLMPLPPVVEERPTR